MKILKKKQKSKNNKKDLYQVEIIGDDIDYFQTIYSQIDSLENVIASLPILSYEWGLSALHQSNLLIKVDFPVLTGPTTPM